jgi:hypothetical protein
MVADMHKQRRPTGLSAGGALLCAEAWQSGLLHRAYPSPRPRDGTASHLPEWPVLNLRVAYFGQYRQG